jgi:hypothetical protein
MTSSFTLYSPSDFSRMDDFSKQAMMDRYNGVFAPLEITAGEFKKAYDTPDIGPHIEKDYKGLSYLSWPFAYRYLKEHFPALFVAFEEKTIGEVVFGGPGYYYLRPYLTDGIKRTTALIFPVMDRKHNAIQQLDGRAISDNCQRAAVKCIATFTGLGLRLYAGEDIPKEDEKATTKLALQQETPKPATRGSKKEAPVAADAADAGAEAAPAAAFDAKEALTSFCKADPLGYQDEQRSLTAGKAALDTLGMTRATEIKSWQHFGNVVSAMVTLWAKDQQIRITKADMRAELDIIIAATTVDEMVAKVAAFVAKKQ